MGTSVIPRIPHDQVETVTKDTTQKDMRHTVLEPKRLDFDQSESHGPTPDKPATSIPRALACLSRLEPHNKAGKNFADLVTETTLSDCSAIYRTFRTMLCLLTMC